MHSGTVARRRYLTQMNMPVERMLLSFADVAKTRRVNSSTYLVNRPELILYDIGVITIEKVNGNWSRRMKMS